MADPRILVACMLLQSAMPQILQLLGMTSADCIGCAIVILHIGRQATKKSLSTLRSKSSTGRSMIVKHPRQSVVQAPLSINYYSWLQRNSLLPSSYQDAKHKVFQAAFGYNLRIYQNPSLPFRLGLVLSGLVFFEATLSRRDCFADAFLGGSFRTMHVLLELVQIFQHHGQHCCWSL